jgi:hypothetical protein
MKKTYATVLWAKNKQDQRIYLTLVKVLRNSLLMYHSKIDFLLLACDMPDLEIDFDAEIRHVPKIPFGQFYSKFNCWNLTDYDKVCYLDADTFAIGNPDEQVFQAKEFTYRGAKGSPLNGGRFVLKPSKTTYQELYNLAKAKNFNKATGWEGCGSFQVSHWRGGEPSDWDFTCAKDDQGLFLYYFHVKRQIAQRHPATFQRLKHSPCLHRGEKGPRFHPAWQQIVKKYNMVDEVREYYHTVRRPTYVTML